MGRGSVWRRAAPIYTALLLALLGVPGAFIAVPAAAMLQVVLEEVVIPWRRRRIAA